MYKEMLHFLNKEKVGVLNVQMPDKTPHGSAMNFAFDEESFTFIFMVNPGYRKCESLFESDDVPASLVIGFGGREMKTIQLDGVVNFNAQKQVEEKYFKKFPDKGGLCPDDLFIVFTPNWWRYTDKNKKVIFRSNGEKIKL